MGAGLIHVRPLHYALSAALLVFYGFYVWETMRSEGDLGEDIKPLYFHRHPVMPHRYRIFLQIGVAVARHHPRRRALREGVQVLSARSAPRRSSSRC